MSAANKIGVLIADENPIVRFRLLDFLLSQPDIYIVGSLASQAQALDLALQTHTDVLIVDVRPQDGGLEGLRALRERLPTTHLIVWSAAATEQEFAAYRQAGAAACLGKDHRLQELLDTIRQVVHPSPAGTPTAPQPTPEMCYTEESGQRC